MVIVQFSGRVSGSGKDPWTMQTEAVLITDHDICNYRGDLIAKKVGELWKRSPMIGTGAGSQYRHVKILTNGHQ